ncbi:MAG TPA: hypothetical protein VFL13_02515 [Candidatus Baltobacteraceae bacterium]|nr:hypothetical protein [Candidatus Baltobacteraceae bacterium]
MLVAAALLSAGTFAAYRPVLAQSASPAPTTAPTLDPDEIDDTPPPIPSPRPAVEDPKIHKIAVREFLAWQTATVNRDLYSDTVNGQLTDDMLDRATKTLANMGALQTATFLGISKSKDASLYVYKMTCVNGSVNMDFSVDPSGKIGLIFFV